MTNGFICATIAKSDPYIFSGTGDCMATTLRELLSLP